MRRILVSMLSPQATTEWHTFAAQCNWSGPHVLDWDRFYRFVIGLHCRGESLSEAGLGELLATTACTPEVREQIEASYPHLKRVLELTG